MDAFKHAVTKTLPAYLQSLPLPDTVAGFQELKPDEWRTLAPFLAALVTVFLLVLSPSLAPKPKSPCVHRSLVRGARGRYRGRDESRLSHFFTTLARHLLLVGASTPRCK